MFGRKKKEEVEVTTPSAIDSAALRMADAAKRMRQLDADVVAAFTEWRAAQSECLKEGIMVELHMSPHFSSAFSTWHDNGHQEFETMHGELPVLGTAS